MIETERQWIVKFIRQVETEENDKD
jgi:hypothetical protein